MKENKVLVWRKKTNPETGSENFQKKNVKWFPNMLLKIPQHAKFWPDKQDKLGSDSHLWRLFILMEAYLMEKSVTSIKDFQFIKFMIQTQNSVNICII